MKKIEPLALTLEKINFNYIKTGWMELAYISPDWKVWKSHKLQNLCVRHVAEILEIPGDRIKDSFFWAEDIETHHKHLFVRIENLPLEYKKDNSYCDYIRHYMNGFVDAIGYW